MYFHFFVNFSAVLELLQVKSGSHKEHMDCWSEFLQCRWPSFQSPNQQYQTIS